MLAYISSRNTAMMSSWIMQISIWDVFADSGYYLDAAGFNTAARYYERTGHKIK